MRHTPGRGSSTSTGLSTRVRAGLAGIALLGASLAGVALTTGSASAASNVTATTTFHAHPDSGNHGTWADDDFTRVATLTYVGIEPTLTNCGATAKSCFDWVATISDTGTFFAISGASSPQAGVSETGSPSGPFKGGSNVTFYSSSISASATGVPTTITGAGPVSTTDWVEQFFPTGTTFGAGPTLTNWSWAYSNPATCENWVDSISNSSGSLPADGDITGVDNCVTSTGEISTFVNHSASCLDNSNETWANGNFEQIWTCGAAGGEDQNFRLAKYNGAQVLQSVAPTTISDAPWCVTASVATAQLSIQACTGTGGQVVGKQGSVYIFTAIGDAMDLSASNTTNGTPVIAYAQTGGKNQEWSLP
jgi:Ricin-type beta-trefoil lectin domain